MLFLAVLLFMTKFLVLQKKNAKISSFFSPNSRQNKDELVRRYGHSSLKATPATLEATEAKGTRAGLAPDAEGGWKPMAAAQGVRRTHDSGHHLYMHTTHQFMKLLSE